MSFVASTSTSRPRVSTRRVVTKISRLRFEVNSEWLRKNLPMNGMSPRNGILSSIAFLASVMRPPMTIVAPG